MFRNFCGLCPYLGSDTRLEALMRRAATLTAAMLLTSALLAPAVLAQGPEDYASWPVLKSTFPSTGGGGMMIKGYDPVISGGKCITTFMAVPAGDNPPVYANLIEFEAVPAAGGTLCTNGRWRAFDGQASGTTPYRIFFKDGFFRGAP
jgi:hypothetical protein